MSLNGAKLCPTCGSIGWKEKGSRMYRCKSDHRFGNKFGAKRANVGLGTDPELTRRFGHFDSRLELDYFREVLGWLEKAGEITELRHHTIIHLIPGFNFETDWDYKTKDGVYRIADTKGVADARFKCIVAMWPFFGHGPLDIVKRSGTKWLIRTVPVGKWGIKPGITAPWEFTKVA